MPFQAKDGKMLELPKNFQSDPPEFSGKGPEALKARNLFRARHIAAQLFDQKGKISQKLIIKALEENKVFTLSSDHSLEAPMREWIIKVLQELLSKESLCEQINCFYKPINMPFGDSLIRLTLGLSQEVSLLEIHAKQAAVVCLLTYLRQNVGSCFATAPAIRILMEQKELFLKDCQELLATGKIERIVDGEKYAVPLSPNWGLGYLNSPIDSKAGILHSETLLKSLEAAGIEKKSTYLEESMIPPGSSFDSILKKVIANSLHINDEKLQVIEDQIAENYHPRGKMIPHSPEVEAFKKCYEVAKLHFLSTTENALLRSWEYTLSSFSEVKAQFLGWNLYHSLGIDTDLPHGIGSISFRYLTDKMEQLKEEVNGYQENYERLFIEAKTLEIRAQRSSSVNERECVLIEYRSRVNEMEGCLAKRDALVSKIERLASLYQDIIREYISLFSLYFQEIYDAGMQSYKGSIFDDSPAGYRLIFKHGRSNPNAWTFIYNSHQFIDALASFFTMTEGVLIEKKLLNGIEKEFSEMVSEIILEIHSPFFLENALKRSLKAHKNGKPWEYISGGSLSALLSIVYGNKKQSPPLGKVIEAPQDLLIFLIETFKDHIPDLTLFATSPTHAFLITPYQEDFKKSWQNNLYTYSWVRDNIFTPRFNFFESTILQNADIQFIIDKSPLPHKKEILEHLSGPLSAFDLMKKVCVFFKNVYIEDAFEMYLYNSLPLFPVDELEMRIDRALDYINVKRIQKVPEKNCSRILSAADLKEGIYQTGGFFEKDPYRSLMEGLEKEGFIPPRALIFADTNWSEYSFAFHIGLKTTELELVLSDYTGSKIRPMGQWRQYLDGRVKEPWTLQLNY